jgi:cellobiose epimerase
MNSHARRNTTVEVDSAGLKNEFRRELHNILDWWSSRMVDEKNGGFYGRIDGYGVLHPESDKGVILNARILWAYSAAAKVLETSHCRRMADLAYDYFCEHFWDGLEGGVFWSVDFQGNPADTQKQVYAQAFAVYALSEYYSLTGNPEALEKATEIFWLVGKYSLDREKGGYLSAFGRDWKPIADIRLSEKDANEAKIMNTHLHVLEAYANFYRVHPSTALRESFENIIGIIINRFYIPEIGSLQIYFDENWTTKGHDISFGHNIEASWLLWEAAEILGNEATQKSVLPVSIHLADATLQSAVDDDGALFYEAGPEGLKDTDKHWWPQTEAVVGFWNTWQLTGENKFREAAIRCWSFIKNFLIDKKNGEWHWRTDRNGVPVLSEDKAGPWKAPYHNSRMCMEMLKRLK